MRDRFLVAALLYFAVESLALPPVERLPALPQTPLFVGWIAGTGSMAPYLRADDYALCAKPGLIKVGDESYVHEIAGPEVMPEEREIVRWSIVEKIA